MIVFVAVDDNNGMIFNNRRQSKDKVLREDILKICNGCRLWMNGYTAGQFEEPLPRNVFIDDSFLEKAEENEFCFVENTSLLKYEDKIKKLYIYRWNRNYPADMYMDLELLQGWKQILVEEFEGNSHKKITREIWINEK